ncbi:MAG: sensor histidine kinase, partial [Gluconobacter cerinus]
LRYAFPENRAGVVRISLHRVKNPPADKSGLVEFELGDDGIGLEASRATESRNRREGIGIQLIRGFARQINADLLISNEDGTWYNMKFVPADPSPTAVAIAHKAIHSEESPSSAGPGTPSDS